MGAVAQPIAMLLVASYSFTRAPLLLLFVSPWRNLEQHTVLSRQSTVGRMFTKLVIERSIRTLLFMMMLVKHSAVLVASPLVALIIDVDICDVLASTTSLHLPVLDQIAFSLVPLKPLLLLMPWRI